MKKSITVAALMLSTASSGSWGAGFSLIEQSVTGLGRAFAGSAAAAEDGSTIFFNAAGLTNLNRAEFDTAVYYFGPRMRFKDNGQSSTTAFGTELTGGGGGDTAQNAFVPNLYYVHPITEQWVAGLGISAPFGLVTDYSAEWKGRYHADKSDVRTLNINPSLAFKANDKVSLGLGLNLQKIDVKLTQSADIGALVGATTAVTNLFTALAPAVPSAAQIQAATLAGGAAGSQAADGYAVLEADDWSWGYNLGLMFQTTEATRIGLSYRSKVIYDLSGSGKLYGPTGSLLRSAPISSKITLPENVSLAMHHQINDQWSIMADATWTRWSRFKSLDIASSDDTFVKSKAENWHNSMRYGIGADYIYNDKWTFRTGIAYDEGVVTTQYRTARLPDEDRYWISMGATYKLSDNFNIDAGYTHIFIKDATINENDDGYILRGKYESSVNIFAAQLRWLI